MSDVKKETKTVEEKIEVGEEVVTAVADKVKASLKEELQVPTAEEIAEKLASLTEKTDKKAIHDEADKSSKRLSNSIGDMDRDARVGTALKAFLMGNRQIVNDYNEFSVKEWRTKADYQNVTTAGDGGALVPDPEFVAEIDRLTDEYGVVARLATVRSTNRDSVTLLSGTNEVSFTATDEATAQNAQKLTYSAATAALKKYIATIVMTSEVLEDSAIAIAQDAANEIARARAKLFDQLVFTDATYGLLSAAVSDAYKTVGVGSALSDFDFDDAMDAVYKVVSTARRNGRFFMHPTVWNELRQKKTGDGSSSAANYYAGGPLNQITPAIDGYPVELVDVLPHSGDITANEAFAVFGDLSRINVHVGRALKLDTFDSGVVKDAGGTDINLITQDSVALRATLRVVPQTRFEGAFVIIGTGTVS